MVPMYLARNAEFRAGDHGGGDLAADRIAFAVKGTLPP